MKLFTALALSMLVAGVAQARPKSEKRIPAIVVDRAGNVVQDLGELPAEIDTFAKENDCYNGGKNSRCIYQLPIKGVVGPLWLTAGDVAGETTLVFTEVPVRMLDYVASTFEACEAKAYHKITKKTCAGFAMTFSAAGDVTYAVGHFLASNVYDLRDSGYQTINFTSAAVDALTRGQIATAMDNTLAGWLLTPACWLIGKPASLLLNGRDMSCAEWVASEREKMNRPNVNKAKRVQNSDR
ncbi:MAG: hypothetical protein KDD34_03235 [Bdellovibrionales bacterium]|nr:hypothetical protein [Bdellovibrionales bacterium]